MVPSVPSRALEACWMSNEAPMDDEVTARVRVAIAGDFQPEHIDGFPMRPNHGSIDLVSPFPMYGFDSRFSSTTFKTYLRSCRDRLTLDPRSLR